MSAPIGKAVGPAYVQQRLARDERRRQQMAQRPRKAYYNPGPEQRAASSERRAQQAAFKAGKQYRRVKDTSYTLRDHIHGGQVKNLAVSGGIALGAGALIHHDRKQASLAKADHTKRDTAAGAVGGAAAADVANVVGGQGFKAVLKERRAARGQSPHESAIWAAHKKSHGVYGPVNGSVPDSKKLKVYRSYPKSLPDWRGQRALAVKNNPKFLAGSLAAGAVTGAAIAHHRAKVAKADRRGHLEEAGVTAVGAGAGQGAYQQAGYSTKHYVDRKTRKGNPGVTPEQVRMQDKALKANKKKFGMGLPKGHPDRNNMAYHRNYPKDLPHAGKIRLLGHTHEGRLGVAVGTGATVLGGAAGLAAARHHVNKRDSEDARMQTRVIRSGPYTKRNRRQLAHHAAVGGVIGGSAGTAVGAHLGAQVHGSILRDSVRELTHPPEVSRGKSALLVGGALGAAGAGYGALTGSAVAAQQRKKERLKAQARHELKQQVAKAEPLALAAGAWKGPGRMAEFKRAFHGTRKGEHLVDQMHMTPKTKAVRDAWGYPRGRVPTGETHGADARKHLNVAISRAHEGSNHRASFRAGVRTGRAAATAGRHPEYAVSVPAAGVGAGVIHHEVKTHKKSKKEASVAKSAFGVEISKYTPGTITYHHEQAAMHSRKKASGGRQVAGGVAVGGAGVAAAGNANRIGTEVANRRHIAGTLEHGRTLKRVEQGARRGGVGLAAVGGATAAAGGARWVHHGRAQNKEAKRAQGARAARNAELAQNREDQLAKSAFFDDQVSKLGPPKVHYQEVNVSRNNEAKRKTTHYRPDTARTHYKGKSLVLRRKKYQVAAYPDIKGKAGDLVHVSANQRLHRDDARAFAHAHETKADHVTTPGGVRFKHEIGKSAFGVADERLEKGFLTSGLEALKGAKNGLSGAVGAEKTGAAAAGKTVGAVTRGKVAPIATSMTKTPARTAATTGVAGLGTGLLLSNKNKS